MLLKGDFFKKKKELKSEPISIMKDNDWIDPYYASILNVLFWEVYDLGHSSLDGNLFNLFSTEWNPYACY